MRVQRECENMKKRPKLIVNADDFGMSHAKNLAIDELMRKGICTNASIVVNMTYTEEAVKMAFSGGYQDKISLHLNLTEGVSISEDIRKIALYYTDNKFAYRPIIKINEQVYPRYIKQLRTEIDAQIQKYISYGFELNSIDSHNWVHLRIPIWLALNPLIRKYNISLVRPMWDGYKKPEIASEKWSKYFTIFQPWLLKCPQCNVLKHTSNIEQFLVDEYCLEGADFVEVFTHPQIVDGQNIDTSSSYLKRPKDTVENNVDLLREYEKVTIKQVLKEIY